MEEQMPVFYIGQHETNRSVPVTEDYILQAHSCNVCLLIESLWEQLY